MSGHPWLDDIGQSAAEAMSDRDPANAGAVELGDGSIRYIAPGSIPDQLGIRTDLHVPVTTARSERTAATSDQRNWGSRGAASVPGPRNKIGK
jgi:hypothetical protein